MKNLGVCYSNHMNELSDNKIALSSLNKHYPIIIIDSCTYQIVTMIQLNEDIIKGSSLHMFYRHSFLYVCKGSFLQISTENYSILFKTKDENFDGCVGGIIPIEKGMYFAIENGKNISILKPILND